MRHMRYEDVLAVGASGNRADLESRLIGVTRALGFDRMSAFLVCERAGGTPQIEIVENTPPEYLATSRNQELALRCPVARHVKQSHEPIVYGRNTYAHSNALDLWEDQARFGYAAGIVSAAHLPNGRHVVLGVDRDREVPQNASERLRLVSTLQLILACIVEPALRHLGGQASQQGNVSITARELEVLRWTASGKSTWAIARILSISEATVNFHVRNAARKLGASSRRAAACRAVALGLIQL